MRQRQQVVICVLHSKLRCWIAIARLDHTTGGSASACGGPPPDSLQALVHSRSLLCVTTHSVPARHQLQQLLRKAARLADCSNKLAAGRHVEQRDSWWQVKCCPRG